MVIREKFAEGKQRLLALLFSMFKLLAKRCKFPEPFNKLLKKLQVLSVIVGTICLPYFTREEIFGINTTSDLSKLLYVISRAVRRVKFETILKYYEWYLCQISRTNHAIICLYYYPQKVCNFHM